MSFHAVAASSSSRAPLGLLAARHPTSCPPAAQRQARCGNANPPFRVPQLSSDCFRYKLRGYVHTGASQAGSGAPGPDGGGNPYSDSVDPAEQTGTEEWRKRPSALSLPKALQSPGAWFVLAGALKVLFLMYANTPVSYMVTVFGSPMLGTMLTALPAAVGLGLLARTIVEKEYHKRRFFVPLALLATLLFCLLCNAFIDTTTGPASQPSIRATSTVSRTISSGN